MPAKSCKTCGYPTLNPTQCPVIGIQYSEDRKQVCPYWAPEVPTCDICGNVDPQCIFSQSSDGSWKRICTKCSQLSGTCGSCSFGTTCDFETNPSPLPKVVQKQVRQGNQIAVVTVMNEERIRETCQKNCKCWSENFGCGRQNNCCAKFEDNF